MRNGIEMGMNSYINQQGIKMLKVEAGSFLMGGETDGNKDALPRHRVTLKNSFFISENPITLESFSVFEKEVWGKVRREESYHGYVIGVSYTEAVAYTEWLTQKEGKLYRLPTEAEWEYTARQREKVQVDRMCDPIYREWCYDWYAPYSDLPEENPAGPVDGMFRCVRGGYLDNPERYNCFPVTPFFRAALPPDYTHKFEDMENDFGRHNIGFRVVQGEKTNPSGYQKISLINSGVRDNTNEQIYAAPDKEKPYFRKRFLLPVPPDNCTQTEQLLGGMHSIFRHHHHSPALTVAPNGDLICSVYSTYHEYDAESGLIGMRLRVGEDEWTFPDEFINAVGVNDHAPLLYTARSGYIYHFWGWPQLDQAYPFQYVISEDNGAHWSDVKFPLFRNKAEFISKQPVNTCIEAQDGTFYLVSDSDAEKMIDDTGTQIVGATSVLWRSCDNMCTWENPKSRTAGRHTTAVELKNGNIFALGGKNTNIDGYMPVAITKDRGDSYTVKKTPFSAMNSGQRPSIVRLKSGKLLVCGDYQTKKNIKPEALKEKEGSYVAWSDDEGETWTFKQLWGAQKRKINAELFGGSTTIGYSVLRQAPDGLIHLICSNVHPMIHLCFNEAWLLSEHDKELSEEELMKSEEQLCKDSKEYREYYSNGKLKCRYNGGFCESGRFLLEGRETFWYDNGNMMQDGCYHLGKKIGLHRYYNRNGELTKSIFGQEIQQGHYEETLKTYWENSEQVRTSTRYVDRKAEGEAVYYSREGTVLQKGFFVNGKLSEAFTDLEK